jgi:hydrogenase expression/formation protein HypE
MFLTTSGIGELMEPVPPGPKSIRVGDVLLVSGPIGRHGLSILCAREGITFDPPPSSDVGDLTPAVESLLKKGIAVRSMRDATRGGVAAVLHEWAEACQKTLSIREGAIPTDAVARSTCELLGLDPLFLACEGVMVVAVDKEQSALALDALRATCIGKQAAVIGQVEEGGLVPVIREGVLGIKHPLEEPIMPSMPRIC